MLLTALGCFFAGIFLPFTAVTKLWLFNNQVSVCRGLVTRKYRILDAVD